ncbi:MAG TPA: helix-turn-helix domain-containing protein [Streptosporangiaceae bacterium]|jgi:DNA-binding HxlR family transcriptional regulator
MALGKDYEGQDCNLARALELIGERWTLLVVRDALYGVRRFGDFQAHLDIPRAVLAERLQHLVQAGVLEKRRYQPSPPRDEYVLTGMGQELWPVVFTLSRWAKRHLPHAHSDRIYRHIACGTELGAMAVCPVCEVAVPAGDVEMSPGSGTARLDHVSRALDRPHRLLQPVAE